MKRENRMRWLGLGAVVGGILFSIYVIGLERISSGFASAPDTLTVIYLMGILAAFLTMLGVIGLYAYQANEGGWPGVAAFVLALLGLVAFLGFAWGNVVFLPMVVAYDPSFSSGQSDVWLYSNAFAISHLLLFLGFLSFGVLTWRTKMYPRGAAVLMILGGLVGGYGIWVPDFLGPGMRPHILSSIGLAWMSIWLAQKFKHVE